MKPILREEFDRGLRPLEQDLEAAEERAARLEARLAAVLDGTLDCIYSLDRDLRFTYLNERARRYFGVEADLTGRSILEVLPGGDRSDFREPFQRVLREGGSDTVEAFFQPSGRWYEARVTASDDGLTVFFRDVTKRRLAEDELRDAKLRATEILDFIPQMTWSADPRGRCEHLSPQWYAFTGREPGSDLGNGWADAIHPDDAPSIFDLWQESIDSASPFQAEFQLRHRSGAYRWVWGEARPMTTREGIIIRWYGTVTDVHDRVVAEQALKESLSFNRSILESSPDCIKLIELDGTILYVNPLGPRALDIEDAARLIGACWFDLLADDMACEARKAVALAGEGQTYQFTAMQPTATGRLKWFDILATPVLDGVSRRVVVVARDITEQKLAEKALRESEILHRSVLEASADCIKIIDLDGRLELMNSPGVCAMELDDFEALRGKNWASLWPAAARRTVQAAVEDARTGTVARFTGHCPTAKGTPKWWDVLVTPMTDEQGEVVRLLCISRDITSSRETAEQLRWASEHDALTSLPNRRSFQAHLQAATIRAMESGGMVGLLLMDLDHFKHVNDTLGHAAGDHLLRTFGQRLKTCVRSHDVVARLGGDEFAVILEGVKVEEDLVRAGESILSRLQTPIRFDGRVLSAGASIGGALFPRDATSANELFKNADTALYALKRAGRGGTRMFHNLMREQAQNVASQLSLARVAISEKSVVPHYQQKVDLATGAICGFEALLRWRHPTRGMQLPDTVAEAFKDYELSSKIGELMQHKVFADMQLWQREGVPFGRVSINAAPAEFLRDDYAERLLARLAEHAIPPSLVEVEVTEHVFIDRGSEYVSRALQALNEAGIRISLDDFGTGYSSLSHLRDFPVDVVKIDRSFIGRMVDEPEIAAIVTAVIDLAASLGIEVVAEGIETERQAELLREKNCATGQGYLFGRAGEADEVCSLLGLKAA